MKLRSSSFFFLLLTACSFQTDKSAGEYQVSSRELPVSKQKQRIVLLQKKLEGAEREQEKATEEVERLAKELHRSQVALIRKQIDDYESHLVRFHSDPMYPSFFTQREMSTLFLKEREELHQLIQEDASSGAQAQLDRILRLITELSDEVPTLGKSLGYTARKLMN